VPSPAVSPLKALAERAMVEAIRLMPARATLRARVLVLGYHNVVPDGVEPTGDRSLHLGLSAFRRQIEILADHAEVVSLAEVGAGTAGRRPRVVITFDDAYRGAVTLAAQELSRLGLPFTLFVTPGRLGDRFWWDTLAPASGSWAPDHRARVLTEYCGTQQGAEEWGALRGIAAREVGPWLRAATEDELIACLRGTNATVGAHSWTHPNLATISPPELTEELERPLRWLRERFDRVLPWLAYPYGSTSTTVARAAREVGYAGAFRIEGGWWSTADDPFRSPRWNVPSGLSSNGFRIRLAGWWCR